MGGDAGAEGSKLPGMTFGLEGIGMGIVGMLDMDEVGVFMGRGRAAALPWREA